MRQYTAENLVIHPSRMNSPQTHSRLPRRRRMRSPNPPDPQVVVEVTPEAAGWDTAGGSGMHFQVRRLDQGDTCWFDTGHFELVLVVLGGTMAVTSNRGQWQGLGRRSDVFSGLPYALYLPVDTALTVTARTACEFAAAWVPADREYAPQLVTPPDVGVEIRGGDHATRQINRIMPPGFPCQRLVVVEVYTPGGNWSSYPPHKHDVHVTAPGGTLLQADLDEIYYYKSDRPEGYALQRIYTDPTSPLHRAGYPIDAAVIARNDDVVLVPEGYHPVSSPVGYTTYYLNVLAGSAQSLAGQDDPEFAWVKETYNSVDPRVPIYDVNVR